MKSKEIGIRQPVKMKDSTIINERGYVAIGPENIDKWLLWVKEKVDKAKNGFITKTHLEEKPDTKHTVIEVEEIKKGKKIKKKVFVVDNFVAGAKDKEEFLELCKDYGLSVSNTETFLNIYWKRK